MQVGAGFLWIFTARMNRKMGKENQAVYNTIFSLLMFTLACWNPLLPLN